MEEMGFVKVASVSEVPPGTAIEVLCGAEILAVCNVDGEIRVASGVCPHAGGPLGQGALNGGYLTCPWHMWQFDSKTGQCDFNPAVRIAVYPIRVEKNQIFVDMVENA